MTLQYVGALNGNDLGSHQDGCDLQVHEGVKQAHGKRLEDNRYRKVIVRTTMFIA